MTPHKIALSQLYLKPGEMFLLEKPAIVSTILGSCIAVTLFNLRLGIAAICHGLLPHCRKHTYINSINDILDGDCAGCADAFKYVDCCVAMMVESFARLGIAPPETQVQLFGGAKMIGHSHRDRGALSVGDQNSAVAVSVITDHGLTLMHAEVGGTKGRKIFFNTANGKVVSHKTDKIISGAATHDAGY